MPNLTNDWSALAESIRGIGADEYGSKLGLVKLLDEKRKTDVDVAGKGIVNAQNQIALDALTRENKFQTSPVTLRAAKQMAIGDDAAPERQIEAVLKMDDLLKTLGVSYDTTNPSPDQALVKPDGTVYTHADLKRDSQKIGGFILATTDPFASLSKTATRIKQEAGPDFATPGPTLTPEQLTNLEAFNPDLAKKYKTVQARFEQASKDPVNIYKDQLGLIDQLVGTLKSSGGDTSLLDERRKEIRTLLGKQELIDIDKQNWMPVTKEQAKVTGIPENTRLPRPDILDIGIKGLADYNKAVKVAEINAQAATTVAATNANKAAEVARINADKDRNQTERANFNTVMVTEAEKAASQVLSTLETSPIGEKFWVEKDASGGVIKVPATSEEILARQRKAANDVQRKIMQDAFDSGNLKRLGIAPPVWVDKSPIDVRAEFKTGVGAVLQALDSASGNDQLTNTFKSQINSTITDIIKSVRTGDTAEIEKARLALAKTTASVQQYLEKQKESIPKQIKKSAQDTANTGLGVYRWKPDNQFSGMVPSP